MIEEALRNAGTELQAAVAVAVDSSEERTGVSLDSQRDAAPMLQSTTRSTVTDDPDDAAAAFLARRSVAPDRGLQVREWAELIVRRRTATDAVCDGADGRQSGTMVDPPLRSMETAQELLRTFREALAE